MEEPILDPQELRAAIIHALVTRLGDVGKIKIQKLVYFLQEAYRVPLGCRFYLHYYGPYSEDVETGISNLKFMGYVSVEPDPDGYGFHVRSISPGEDAWNQIVGSFEEKMGDAIQKLGTMEAWKLELMATIHYVSTSLDLPKREVVSVVTRLKPKFEADFVETTFRELASMGLMPPA
jgi:uncharacterized protein YwgA